MTIRTRILLFSFIAGTLITGGIITYSTLQMRRDAESYYISSSSAQLRLMNIYIETFVNTAINNAEALTRNPDFAKAGSIFPNYTSTTTETVFRLRDLSPEARELAGPLVALAQGYEDYVEVYAGYADGSLVTSIDGLKFPAGWNMSKRPWYVTRANSSSDYGLAEAYTSVTGEMVFAISHKIRTESGEVVGVLGIDVTLKGLTDKFRELSSGDNGYFVLIENTGRVLCEPTHPELTGKVVGKDIVHPGMMEVFAKKNGIVRFELDGEWQQANVLTNAFGWKLISVQSESAIYGRSNATMRHTAILTTILGLLAIMGVMWLVRSINRPLSLIVSTATDISAGNLDARLDPRDYYGELSQLQQALTGMVTALKERIAEAAEQSALAQQEMSRAQEATRQAEEARNQAENARREGMLAAAEHLEEAVENLNAASQLLSRQIAQADQNARMTSQHLAESATAMNEMNATVHEVARNASTASAASAETRSKAAAGSQVVERSVHRIQAVRQASLELKNHMTELVTHAQDINQIMGVISDIADQTNLLALNAAIEAARAGDAGRGFAVVADEVRNLAEKTMASTQDVASAIKAIQDSTTRSMNSVDSAVDQIEEATHFVTESGEALQDIVETVDATADQVRAIAAASEEQSAASEEINRSIVQCNEASQQISVGMDEAAHAMADLARQTKELTALVASLKNA